VRGWDAGGHGAWWVVAGVGVDCWVLWVVDVVDCCFVKGPLVRCRGVFNASVFVCLRAHAAVCVVVAAQWV
jgi:hypothetical protein